MKKITNIEIKNFRAFFDRYNIELNNGENLLIYGENGSGKSSLYKSLSNFLSSSQNRSFQYIKNHYKSLEEGNLNFTFNDYDVSSNMISSHFGEVLNFGSDFISTDTEQFLKTAELTKGFLDYKALLAVYNHNEAQPNLFDLIVLNLFKDFIPSHLGGTDALGTKFNKTFKKITEAYTRNTYDYWEGIPEMENYENLLRKVLNEVFLQLNYFLMKYFKLNLRVEYILQPLVSTGWWREIPKVLKLHLKLNGIQIGHQSDFLNEARLSALAICLYLSVVKKNPQAIDFKILFLDDVFIGLDLTNRLPILDIIKNEFSDYQVFISTYDRHLYEMAKRKFETEAPGKWKTIELYVGKDQINTQSVDRPVLVNGDSYYEKATQYLHDIRKPDYPAAANYFRKTIEQIISEEVPNYEKIDENKVQIPEYKLGPLIYRTKRFLERISQNTETVNSIVTLLPTLLHPLSHHEISSPVYKGELLQIENLIPKFLVQLRKIDFANTIKCSNLEGRNEIIIKYSIDTATRHFSYYYLRTIEPMLLFKDDSGRVIISETKCCIEKCYGEKNGIEIPRSRKNFSKDEKSQPINNFNSILEAYDTIYSNLIINPLIGNFPKDINYLDAIKYKDDMGVYQPISNAIVW